VNNEDKEEKGLSTIEDEEILNESNIDFNDLLLHETDLLERRRMLQKPISKYRRDNLKYLRGQPKKVYF